MKLFASTRFIWWFFTGNYNKRTTNSRHSTSIPGKIYLPANSAIDTKANTTALHSALQVEPQTTVIGFIAWNNICSALIRAFAYCDWLLCIKGYRAFIVVLYFCWKLLNHYLFIFNDTLLMFIIYDSWTVREAHASSSIRPCFIHSIYSQHPSIHSSVGSCFCSFIHIVDGFSCPFLFLFLFVFSLTHSFSPFLSLVHSLFLLWFCFNGCR